MLNLRIFAGRRSGGTRPSRILVASTPRSGNTWLRHQLNSIYCFSAQPRGELAVHTVDSVPWNDLPTRCILQLHWHHIDPLASLLREHEFRVLTLARHPFAVLLSILQYCQHVDSTYQWLSGEGGDESRLRGASPCCPAFVDYAASPRAAALLSVSPEWWEVAGALRVRYEDLVADTPANLGRLTRNLEPVTAARIAQAISSCTIDRLRRPENAPHFWQGAPDLWRSLLTADVCRRIYEAHPMVFRALGYRCDPDLTLSPELARARWRQLTATPRWQVSA